MSTQVACVVVVVVVCVSAVVLEWVKRKYPGDGS